MPVRRHQQPLDLARPRHLDDLVLKECAIAPPRPQLRRQIGIGTMRQPVAMVRARRIARAMQVTLGRCSRSSSAESSDGLIGNKHLPSGSFSIAPLNSAMS